jgi:anti-sigma factor RsiW
MHEQWEKQLPFYVAGALPAEEHAALEQHLKDCAACRDELTAWRHLAAAVRGEAEERATALPPISPVVRANLKRPPSSGEAMWSSARLIGAQWPVLRSLLPVALLVLLLGVFGTLALRDDTEAALPLLTLVPIVGALCVSFLHHGEVDPAWEIVAAAPTSPGALVFARLTLILGAIVLVMLGGILTVSMTTGEMVGPLVAVWLGPLLLLSALATVLAIRWTAAIGAGVSLVLWLSVISMLVKELAGNPLPMLSLQPLLDPGWLLFGGHLVAAALLWYLSWRLARSRFVLIGELN